MAHRILLVDDEANILQGYQRVLKKSFNLEVALGGTGALETLDRRAPFAVLVPDMRMPDMSGLDLLVAARSQFPDTTRIMLTGNSDQKTAMDAVNHGQVFRFLAKPCPPEGLELALLAGIRQHQLVVAERELLELQEPVAILLSEEAPHEA